MTFTVSNMEVNTMAERKMLLCVCGAGINTSINAEHYLQEYVESIGRTDIEVKHCMVGDILAYKDRKNMVVVWMTAPDPTFGSPAERGLPFMIGTKKAKQELAEKIVRKLDEISEE